MIPTSGTNSPQDALPALYEQLNRADVDPVGMYRCNAPGFDLIASANIVAGCLASKNYEAAAVFLGRCAEAIQILRSPRLKRPQAELAYFELVERYLMAAARFIPFEKVDAFWRERVPVAWQCGGGD